MFSRIREYIYRRRVNRLHHSAESFARWSSVKDVLLLFDSDAEEKNLAVKQLIKELRAEGKRVVAWGYVDKKTAQATTLPDYFVFANDAINWLHCPNDERVMCHLKDKHFDLLIDLTMQESLPMRYLSLYASAGFRAGRQTEKEPYLNDFMISLTETSDVPYLFDQIMYYLKQIRSND